MPRIITTTAMLLVSGLMSSFVEARPLYLSIYKESFRTDRTTEALKCNACHFGDRKTNRNDYAKAFEKRLPGKNIRDIEVIRRILMELGPITEWKKPSD